MKSGRPTLQFYKILSTGLFFFWFLLTQVAFGGPAPKIALRPVVNQLRQPLALMHAGDGSGRLFIVEQKGVIRILKNGVLLNIPFLDIRDRVISGGEKGLLGLAFHPDFLKNGRFFVNYTTSKKGLKTIISEYKADKSLESAHPKNENILLTIPQPFENHNGGNIAFGPDGKLYIGMGDGGAGNDPEGHGQNLSSLLGKMLRIDVDRKEGGKAYAIPSDNPLRSHSKFAPEIWAYGLRNPWRFSFDSQTGDLWVGDVGQNHREEINIVKRGGNYGWNTMEGTICTPGVNQVCDKSQYALPVFDYPRSEGTVVIGGFVYRGNAIPALKGAYLYGDFGNGRISMLHFDKKKSAVNQTLLETNRMISAFGEDAQGELYVIDYQGEVLKIVEGSQK